MRVIFDATVFCADFPMLGNAFRIFLSSFAHAGLEPCIPESVRDEVINKYRERCHATAEKAQNALREHARITGSTPYRFPLLSATQLEDFYRTKLIRLFAKGFRDLKYPTITHKELAERALRRSRPFRESGVGYRDALLWYAILQELREQSAPVAFVTANDKDFAENGALHPDLCSDLAAIGLPPGTVRLFRTLEALNHALVLPTLERLAILRAELNSGGGPAEIRAWIVDELRYYLEEDQGLGPLEPGHGRSRFRCVSAIKSLTVDSIKKLIGDEILIAATSKVRGILDVSVSWSDYQTHEDVREFFDADNDEPFSSVSADFPIDVTVAFSLILNAESMAVISGEIDGYETDYCARTEINPHPEDDLPDGA